MEIIYCGGGRDQQGRSSKGSVEVKKKVVIGQEVKRSQGYFLLLDCMVELETGFTFGAIIHR